MSTESGLSGLSGLTGLSGVTVDNFTPIPGTQIFLDHFNGSGLFTDHLPDFDNQNRTESVWLLLRGTAVLSGGKVDLSTTFGFNEIETSFQQIGVTIILKTTFAPEFGSNVIIIFNKVDDLNYCYIYHSPPYVQLWEVVDGVGTQRGDTYTGTIGYTQQDLVLSLIGDFIGVALGEDAPNIITYIGESRPNQNGSGFAVRLFHTSGAYYVDDLSVLGSSP